MNFFGRFSVWSRLFEGVAVFRAVARAGLLSMTLGALAALPAPGPKQAHLPVTNSHYASLPLAFEQNRGQTNPQVKFLARGVGYAIFFTEKEAVMSLDRSEEWSSTPFQSGSFGSEAGKRLPEKDVLRLNWVGAAASPRVEGLEKESGKSNYLTGDSPAKWVRGVPDYARVKYHSVYPGIDVVYYGNQRELEFDIDVAPSANLAMLRLKIAGVHHRKVDLSIDRQGDLVVRTRAGDVQFRKLHAYQPDGKGSGGKKFLQARYILEKDGQVGFDVRGYNRAKPLVIDPVLVYSTYLGGTDYNYATGIAVDSSGNTYITGYTSSVDFPVSGGVQSTFAGGSCDTEVNTAPCFDAFVAKLNPKGSALVYSTYLGGTGDDRGVRIAIDSSGEAYVAGYTDSLDFPTEGPLQGAIGGGTCGTSAYPEPCYDAFVAKLSASGSNLIYSTYLGGTGDDFASSIAVDSDGDAFVGGLTSATNFPVTAGAFQTSYGGGAFDGFVAKINAAGTALVYSTYLGGSLEDHVNGVALDSAGNAYLTGQTDSSDFPVKDGFQPKYTATTCGSALSSIPCFEGFVTKLNSKGSSLVYSSYLGGTAATYGLDIALDSFDAAYVTGWTTSGDFPVTPGAFQSKWGGGDEVFVAKTVPAGDALDYATYLGGINPDQANAIAVDSAGDAFIAGSAYGGKFPVADPLQADSGGFYDAFVSEFNSTGSGLLFSTYLGGTGDEAANGIAVDSSGNIFVAGDTFSTDFPVTPSAMTTTYTGGSYDAWIAEINPRPAVELTAAPNPLAFASQEINTTSAASTVTLGDAGLETLDISGISVTGDFAETSQCGDTISPGTQCAVNVTFTPTAAGERTGSLEIQDNAPNSPQTIDLNGLGTSGVVSLSNTSLDFGPVAVGDSSTKTVTLTNTAKSPLDISSLQAGGDYTETNTCGNSVNAGKSCSITVTFSPDSLGTIVGAVTITDTAPDSPEAVTLTGTGATPPAASLSPTSLSFGSQTVGTTSLPQVVTLTNTGGAPMTINAIKASDSFGESNNCGSSLAPKANCAINVTFKPMQTGTQTGTLSISDDAAGSPQTVSLSGTGDISFTLTAKQNSVTVLQGSGQAQFTLSASTSDGFTGSIVLGCTNISPATCSFDPASISPGQSTTLTVGNLSAVTSSSLDFTVTGTVATTNLSATTSTATSSSSSSTSGSTTATLPLSVEFADFTLAVSPTDASIQAGGTASYTLTLTPANGFDLPVSLACTEAPKGATCSFSSSTVKMDSSSPAKVTLTVQTTAQSYVLPPPEGWWAPTGPSNAPWLVLLSTLLAFMLVIFRARKEMPSLRSALRSLSVIVLVCLMFGGCGGGGGSTGTSTSSSNGTPAGTYTLTVSATAQSLNHKTAVKLKVS